MNFESLTREMGVGSEVRVQLEGRSVFSKNVFVGQVGFRKGLFVYKGRLLIFLGREIKPNKVKGKLKKKRE